MNMSFRRRLQSRSHLLPSGLQHEREQMGMNYAKNGWERPDSSIGLFYVIISHSEIPSLYTSHGALLLLGEGWIWLEGERTWNRLCYKYNSATFNYSSGANLVANSSFPSCFVLESTWAPLHSAVMRKWYLFFPTQLCKRWCSGIRS